jgi:hypothetical protein
MLIGWQYYKKSINSQSNHILLLNRNFFTAKPKAEVCEIYKDITDNFNFIEKIF